MDECYTEDDREEMLGSGYGGEVRRGEKAITRNCSFKGIWLMDA